MATDNQYLFFKSLYDEENERTNILAEHAKNNLSLATLYSAFILFVIEKQADHINLLAKVLFCSAIAFMLGAFFLSLLATQIADYEVASDPEEIFDHFGPAPPTDEEFFDDRIVEYTAAYVTNAGVNDKKANELLFARYLLLGGITLHASYFIARIVSM